MKKTVVLVFVMILVFSAIGCAKTAADYHAEARKYAGEDVRVVDKTAFSFDMVGGHYTRKKKKKKPLLTQREDVVYYDSGVGAFRLIVVEGGGCVRDAKRVV
jgi:hypothetical protein